MLYNRTHLKSTPLRETLAYSQLCRSYFEILYNILAMVKVNSSIKSTIFFQPRGVNYYPYYIVCNILSTTASELIMLYSLELHGGHAMLLAPVVVSFETLFAKLFQVTRRGLAARFFTLRKFVGGGGGKRNYHRDVKNLLVRVS